MRRRDFIRVVAGGVALAAPVSARSQQPTKPVIGYLSVQAIAGRRRYIEAFRSGLASEGFIEGQNLTIEYRADGRPERLSELAADLVRRGVAAIATSGGPPARRQTRPLKPFPSCSRVAVTPCNWVWCRVLAGQIRTLRESISNLQSWWRSGWRCCASYCRGPRALRNWSIRPMQRRPSQPSRMQRQPLARSVVKLRSSRPEQGTILRSFLLPSEDTASTPCSWLPIRCSPASPRVSRLWPRSMRCLHPTFRFSHGRI